jgi:acetolactate synthase-1/2/3 large subunit
VIKVSDYLARRVAELGVKHVFLIPGGGAMHLNDGFGKCPGLQYVCNHHEQASAIAVEAYSRVTGNIGVACVTSGPGGTNTLTGVLGCWLDSIPGLFLSGQIKTTTMVASTGLPLRQFGDQEADIIAIVSSITKYAVVVTDPKTIRYHFDKAIYLARHGRPGPVWLDIPLDVQTALVEESDLLPYDEQEDVIHFDPLQVAEQVAETLRKVRSAERPVLLGGGGIRLAGALDVFREVIDLLNIPVQTAIGAHDIIESDHRLFFGRPSVTGDRSSNFILQNSDLLLAVGSRLGVRQVSYNFPAFARAAHKIAVDVDAAELRKPSLSLDQPIHCDAKLFLEEMLRQLRGQPLEPRATWIDWCRERRRRYPSVLPEHRDQKGSVNYYWFVEVLSRVLPEGQIIVLANGTANVTTFQAIKLKKGQRLFTNSGCATMGYDLPAAIGACFASGKKDIVCLAGDGSIQMNVQELQTIAHHHLPIKIFVLSNDGYVSMRMTQEAYFKGQFVGANGASGVTCPDMVKLAGAYGIPAIRIQDHEGLEHKIRALLATPGPVLCDLVLSPEQAMLPKIASRVLADGTLVSSPMEDMYPFLERHEFAENMIIPPWDPAPAAPTSALASAPGRKAA